MNLSQMRAFEPGDAEWGVKLEDVRGQEEAKEEVRRVVTIWQSGEAFERAGGKRERGLLFLGAPGTGKTMLAKALATGFNSPFVSMPGSGFAATFIGIDAIIVRLLARRAKKLARKWGGQCIVFIDEIDAVGMRRQALQQMAPATDPYSWRDVSDFSFYGPWGAQNPSGDLIVETRRWRDRLFEERAPSRWTNPIVNRIVNQFPGGMMGGMMGGGQLALNQLLVAMDGIDSPPFLRRVLTNRINTLLDASYLVPRRIGKLSLRIPRARPRGEQIYYIGATNVPMDRLDPALTRPGRMGRHVNFRTPTKEDRKDVFDLYLGKVAHDPELDEPKRRDEIARITNGYSPAMIDQVCSMALTNAQHEGKIAFGWEHLVQSMTTLESGTAVNVSYPGHELRAVAIHEAGHAVTAHMYRPDLESSRLSTRMRGGSLGHHQTFEREERFSRWQHEEMGTLIHVLGAMAAENVFYGENTGGVGGDLQTATDTAAWMVGTAGMRPLRIDLEGHVPEGEDEDEYRDQIMKRFERIGRTLMNRTRGSADFHADPIASILHDHFKSAVAAQILGQAYVIALNLVKNNQDSRRRDRDPSRRGARAVRRRTRRAARQAAAREAGARLHEGRDMAEDVVPVAPTAAPHAGSRRARAQLRLPLPLQPRLRAARRGRCREHRCARRRRHAARCRESGRTGRSSSRAARRFPGHGRSRPGSPTSTSCRRGASSPPSCRARCRRRASSRATPAP